MDIVVGYNVDIAATLVYYPFIFRIGYRGRIVIPGTGRMMSAR